MLYIVFFTDTFIPSRFDGITYGPLIFIRPARINNRGILEHEKIHVKQFWRSFGLFGIGYLFSKKFRIKCEVEAYKEQLKYSPGREQVYAGYISTRYNAGISVDDALKLLTA